MERKIYFTPRKKPSMNWVLESVVGSLEDVMFMEGIARNMMELGRARNLRTDGKNDRWILTFERRSDIKVKRRADEA